MEAAYLHSPLTAWTSFKRLLHIVIFVITVIMLIMVLIIKTTIINIIKTTVATPSEPYGEDQIERKMFRLGGPKVVKQVMFVVLIVPSEKKGNMASLVPSEKEEGEYGKSCLLGSRQVWASSAPRASSATHSIHSPSPSSSSNQSICCCNCP